MKSLKPCPFCGGAADLRSRNGRYGYFVFCECSICSAQGKPFALGRDLPARWGESTGAVRAADAWNRRWPGA